MLGTSGPLPFLLGFHLNENLKTLKEIQSETLCPRKLESQDEHVSSRNGSFLYPVVALPPIASFCAFEGLMASI